MAHQVLAGLTQHRIATTSQLRRMLRAELAQEVRLGAAVLEDLEQHGPAQIVWMPLVGGTPRPWTDL
ncbi:hypothetical protein ACIRP3_42615 [Streptomyces sp. NPDC101209]|uniref:hypothetical protein n=1 Tax=Streptomyces sp. NPDC101209 TaxID=3366129 RepID=UPI003825EC9E